MSELYVMGHKNPDTDAICGAIALADFLSKTVYPHAQPSRCGEVPERTAWVLEQAGLEAPKLITNTADCVEGVDFALVDHNEFSQSVDGIADVSIVYVLDHHRLAGDVTTKNPIRFINEPVGSSCTIIAREYKYAGLTPSKSIAMCLCAGLISDTLLLTSPTTTDLDREILPWIAELAEINPEEFTEGFFAVGSLLSGGTPEAVLNTDRKDFTSQINGKSFTIAQIEERGLASFEERRQEFELELNQLCIDGDYSLALLAVTDIKENSSMIIAAGKSEAIDSLPFERKDDTLFFGRGVCSRKKQIGPAAEDAVEKL